jgi:hypothetical protein
MKECKQCKLIKLIKSLQFGIKEMKSILIYDLFYYITFDIVSFLLKINGDKYVLVVIGHHLVVWGVTNERTLCYYCNQVSRRNYMHSWVPIYHEN